MKMWAHFRTFPAQTDCSKNGSFTDSGFCCFNPLAYFCPGSMYKQNCLNKTEQTCKHHHHLHSHNNHNSNEMSPKSQRRRIRRLWIFWREKMITHLKDWWIFPESDYFPQNMIFWRLSIANCRESPVHAIVNVFLCFCFFVFGCGCCSVTGWWETGSGLRRQKWVTDAKSLGSQTQNTARTPKKYRVITPKKYGVMHRFSYH